MTFPEMSLSRSEFGGVWDKERKKKRKLSTIKDVSLTSIEINVKCRSQHSYC